MDFDQILKILAEYWYLFGYGIYELFANRFLPIISLITRILLLLGFMPFFKIKIRIELYPPYNARTFNLELFNRFFSGFNTTISVSKLEIYPLTNDNKRATKNPINNYDLYWSTGEGDEKQVTIGRNTWSVPLQILRVDNDTQQTVVPVHAPPQNHRSIQKGNYELMVKLTHDKGGTKKIKLGMWRIPELVKLDC